MLNIVYIRWLQIKTTDYQHVPIRMNKIQSTENTKYWGGGGVIEALIHC